MRRRVKAPVRFSASLPAQIIHSTCNEKVTRKVWGTLPDEQRSYALTGRTAPYRCIYYKVLPIPPYDNPAIDRLRKKLKAQRVQWSEQRVFQDGREYVNFSTME